MDTQDTTTGGQDQGTTGGQVGQNPQQDQGTQDTPAKLYATRDEALAAKPSDAPKSLKVYEVSKGGVVIGFMWGRGYDPCLAALARKDTYTVSTGGEEEAQRTLMASVSPEYFDVLQTPPLYGRTFVPHEMEFGRHRVVILRHDFWSSRLGGDPGAIGRTIRVNGTPMEIVGVMPPRWPGAWSSVQVWRTSCRGPTCWMRHREFISASGGATRSSRSRSSRSCLLRSSSMPARRPSTSWRSRDFPARSSIRPSTFAR